MSKSFKLLVITLTFVPTISENVMPAVKFHQLLVNVIYIKN
jgi:hypothetical protein